MNASAVSLLFMCLCYRAGTDFVSWIDTSYPLFFSHIPFPFIKLVVEKESTLMANLEPA